MLPRFIFILSTLILASCSEQESNTSHSKAWSLDTPILISSSEGLQYSLKELEIKRPTSLNSSDRLHFRGMTENLRMQILSVCNEGSKRKVHEINTKLTDYIQLSEIIPPEARVTGQWVCSFQFIAQHPNGSEHYFELSQYIMKDDFKNHIRITDDPSSMESTKRLHGNQSDNHYAINKGIGRLHMHCDEYHFITDHKKSALRMSELIPKNKIPNNKGLRCRVFEITGENRVISSSESFWRFPNDTSLDVTELRNQRQTYQTPQRLSFKAYIAWSFENTSKDPIYIALKKDLNPEEFKLINYYNRKFNSEKFFFPVGYSSNAKSIQIDPHYLIYEVPAQSIIKLKLGTLQKWDCGFLEHGFYVSPGQNHLEALVLTEAKIIDESIIQEKVELNYVHDRWVGLSEPIRDQNGLKGQAYGHYDQYGAMPVKAETEKKVFCRTP